LDEQRPRRIYTMSNWVDEFLTRIEAAVDGVLEIEVGGQKIVAEIGDDLVDFFKKSRKLLLRVGKSTFRSFLLLLSEKKEEQAFNLLLAKMDAEDLILRMEQNADALQEYNDNRKDFYDALKKFALNTLAPTLAKALVGLLI